jgi:hypothetical protein
MVYNKLQTLLPDSAMKCIGKGLNGVVQLHQLVKCWALIAVAASAAPAGGAPLKRDNEPGQSTYKPAGERSERVVANKSIPLNQRFATLDAYLAYLEKRSHADGAWYREIRPGIYRYETGNFRPDRPDDQKRIFTRAELASKFGFDR